MALIHELSKALINLNCVTQTCVSQQSGVQKGNLSIWLQGKRKLSEHAEESILNALGVYAGELDIRAVHNWTVGTDLTNLNFVLDTLCAAQPLLQMIMPNEITVGSKHKFTDYPLFSISNNVLPWVPRIKVIIKFKPSTQEQIIQKHDAKSFLKNNITRCKWFIDAQPHAIPTKVYRKWQEGKATHEEFDELIIADRSYDWGDAMELAEDNEITASEVIGMIKQMIKDRKDNL